MGAEEEPLDLSGVDLVEAKNYLLKHGVHVLFEKLAAELIRERPPAPLDYVARRVDEIRSSGVKAKVVLVLGPPGCGKATLLQSVPAGLETKDYSGRDDDAEALIADLATVDEGKTVVVKGFPRNLTDALHLQKAAEPKLVVTVTCDKNTCEKRLFQRGLARDQQVTLEQVKKWNAAYVKSVAPVMAYYDAAARANRTPEKSVAVRSTDVNATKDAFAKALSSAGL